MRTINPFYDITSEEHAAPKKLRVPDCLPAAKHGAVTIYVFSRYRPQFPSRGRRLLETAAVSLLIKNGWRDISNPSSVCVPMRDIIPHGFFAVVCLTRVGLFATAPPIGLRRRRLFFTLYLNYPKIYWRVSLAELFQRNLTYAQSTRICTPVFISFLMVVWNRGPVRRRKL